MTSTWMKGKLDFIQSSNFLEKNLLNVVKLGIISSLLVNPHYFFYCVLILNWIPIPSFLKKVEFSSQISIRCNCNAMQCKLELEIKSEEFPPSSFSYLSLGERLFHPPVRREICGHNVLNVCGNEARNDLLLPLEYKSGA